MAAGLPGPPPQTRALTGKFDDHHAELGPDAADQIDALSGQIGRLTTRMPVSLPGVGLTSIRLGYARTVRGGSGAGMLTY